MSPRDRNALLVVLTASGPHQFRYVRATPCPTLSDEEWARLMVEHLLAELPCYSATELKRRCLSPASSAVRPNRSDS